MVKAAHGRRALKAVLSDLNSVEAMELLLARLGNDGRFTGVSGATTGAGASGKRWRSGIHVVWSKPSRDSSYVGSSGASIVAFDRRSTSTLRALGKNDG